MTNSLLYKKALGILLVLFLLLPAALSKTQKAYALDDPRILGIDQAYVDGLGKNLLQGKTADCRTLSGTSIQPDEGVAGYMTDGVVFQTAPRRKADFYRAQMTVSYDMGALVTCNKILVVGMYADFGDFGLGQYELYLSAEPGNLFSPANKLASYDNAGKWSPQVPNSGAAALFTFDGNPVGRYFGIKILKSDYNGDGYTVVRIDELAVYGCAPVTSGVDQNYLTNAGNNLLAGKTPVCKTIGGSTVYPNTGELGYMTDGLVFESSPTLRKADFYRAQMTVQYDLGRHMTFEKILVAGMYAASGDYGLGQYELYVSNSSEQLFAQGNRIAAYDNQGMWNPAVPYSGSAAVFEPYHKPAGRYFGIKILKPDYNNDGYTVIRIDELAVYGTLPKTGGIDQQYAAWLGTNLLSGKTPVCRDRYGQPVSPDIGQLGYLTDGIVFQTSPHRLKVDFYQPEMTIAFDMGTEAACGTVLVAGMYETYGDYGLGQYELYLSPSEDALFDSHHKIAAYDNQGMWSPSIPNSGAAAAFSFYNVPRGRYFGIRILKPDYNNDGYTDIRIDELAVYAHRRTVTVEETVINPDFAGVGVNVIPTALMPVSMGHGYNEAYWEMDKKRILMMKPKLARVLFQTDWMEPSKGVYTWNSPKMQAFCRYLDVLKAAGCEVELNFGWKVAAGIQSWFSIPGVSDPANSAPADLNAFAAACSESLRFLIHEKGYGNIKYLSFYNEPNFGEFLCAGDMQAKKAYYAEMVRKVADRLTADGRRSLVKLWAAEDAGSDTGWFTYLKQYAGARLDGYSYHAYNLPYARLRNFFQLRTAAVSPSPVFLTEFGWGEENASGWDGGYSNYVISAAGHGISGLMAWQLNGAWLEDPFAHGSTDNSNFNLWNSLPSGGLTPNQSYYEVGLLSRYIPAHSQAVAVSANDRDIRAAAFRTSGGQYTVLVESKGGSGGPLRLDFGNITVGKSFRRHVYTPGIAREQNALIPAVSGTFDASRGFTDPGIPGGYCVIVYTTLPAQAQVLLNPVHTQISRWSTLQLQASVLDAPGGVTWSVVSGGGTVSSSGLYTPSSAARVGDLIAVKAAAALAPDAYGIALIRIS